MTNADENPSLKWWVLATVIVGTFLGRIDQNIVNLALPKMISDFGITVSTAGWIATAYILANAIFVPIWGKLGDTIGRKKIYVLGFSIFIFGSVLAGFAWNFGSMIVFRIIQAIASSADYPTAMAIIAVTFPAGKERAQALGIWSSSFAAASVFGPLIGGPMIDLFGWRSVFLINLPVGLIGLAMALTFIHESTSEKKTVVFDWWGATTLGIVLSAMVLVLDKGMDWGWLSVNSLLCYGTIAVFSWIFYTIERDHTEPIIDLKFFTIPLFVNALANNFIMFVGLMGSIFLIPIFAQTFLGYNATQTGMLFIPMAVGLMLAAPIGGSLIGRVRANIVIFWSTLGAAFAIYLYTFIDAKSTVLELSIPLAIMSLTMGFGMAQRTAVVAAAVPQSEIGIASAILALVRNTAGAFGIALFGTILQYSEKVRVLSIAQNSVIRSTNPEVIQQGIALIELKAQVAAYSDVFLIASMLVAVGAFAALFMKLDHDLPITQEQEEQLLMAE